MADGRIALIALIALAVWIFVGLPLIYLPDGIHAPAEILGIKLSDWLLSAATFGLWYATWRLVKGGEQTAERQLRAYVGIESCKVTTDNWGQTFYVEVQLKNAGQTPAYNVSHRIIAGLQVRLEPPDFAMPFRSPGIIPVAPGMTFAAAAPVAIGGPSGVATIGSGRIIFAWGRVDYLDAFGKSHYLEFRFASGEAIQEHDGTVTRTVGWKMYPQDEGNAAG
jgi:hypothetical protein